VYSIFRPTSLQKNKNASADVASPVAACRHEALRTASDEARMLEIVLDMYQDKTMPGAQESIVQDGVSHTVLIVL
jgi:hypothetical protein